MSAVSSKAIGTAAWPTISPASGFSVMKWRVTPVSVSPFTSTQLTGALPRYFGSSEPWRFIAPSGGISRISFFNIDR